MTAPGCQQNQLCSVAQDELRTSNTQYGSVRVVTENTLAYTNPISKHNKANNMGRRSHQAIYMFHYCTALRAFWVGALYRTVCACMSVCVCECVRECYVCVCVCVNTGARGCLIDR